MNNLDAIIHFDGIPCKSRSIYGLPTTVIFEHVTCRKCIKQTNQNDDKTRKQFMHRGEKIEFSTIGVLTAPFDGWLYIKNGSFEFRRGE